MESSWDEILAQKVADKVLAVIGDQLKMPEPLAEIVGEFSAYGEYRYAHPVGFGPNNLAAEWVFKNGKLELSLKAMNGQILMRLNLH